MDRRITADDLVAQLNAIGGDRYVTSWDRRKGYVIMNLSDPAPDVLTTVQAAKDRISAARKAKKSAR
jgi:hypothetical protein